MRGEGEKGVCDGRGQSCARVLQDVPAGYDGQALLEASPRTCWRLLLLLVRTCPWYTLPHSDRCTAEIIGGFQSCDLEFYKICFSGLLLIDLTNQF